MFFDDPDLDSVFGAGDSSWFGIPSLQTTVSPGDLVLPQPSQPDDINHGSSLGHNTAGYPAVGIMPRQTLQHFPPVWRPHLTHHHSAQLVDASHRSFTGPIRRVRSMHRGVRADQASVECQWQSPDSSTCGQIITGDTVPMHLTRIHEIRGLCKDFPVECRWQACGTSVTRQSIARHLREVHLGLKRKSGGSGSSSSTASVAGVL